MLYINGHFPMGLPLGKLLGRHGVSPSHWLTSTWRIPSCSQSWRPRSSVYSQRSCNAEYITVKHGTTHNVTKYHLRYCQHVTKVGTLVFSKVDASNRLKRYQAASLLMSFTSISSSSVNVNNNNNHSRLQNQLTRWRV